jgi:hypothetical protein
VPPIPETAGPLAALKRDASYRPGRKDLAAFAGTYASDEAETRFTIEVDDEGLVLKRRPADEIRLRPRATDAFDGSGGLGVIVFRRGSGGGVTELSVVQDRVWDLRFRRLSTRRGSLAP